MPNWKKVVVSGSNASLNSVTVSNGVNITGSVIITGSSYSNGGTFTFTGSYGSFLIDPTTPFGPFGIISVSNSEDAALLINNNTPGGWGLTVGCIDNDTIIASSITGSAIRVSSEIGTAIVGGSTYGKLVELGNASGNKFIVKNNGNTIITGSLAVGNLTGSAIAGRIDASADVVAFSTSDKRLKENIIYIDKPLEKLTQIGGYEFDWKSDPNLKELHGFEGHDIGVIAQEIQKVLPEVVTERENGYLAVKYEKIIALLIESNKELLKRVETLEEKLQGNYNKWD